MELSQRKHKISRCAYIAEAALEYFIATMISGAYLTNLLNELDFTTAQQTVISSLVTVTFSAELFSVMLIRKRSSVKRWVTAWNFFNQMLFALVYFTPFFKIPTNLRSVVFLVLLIAGSMIEHTVVPFRTTWHMSNVENYRRGIFTATKEIFSLLGGIVFTFVMGSIIDTYEAAGNIRGSFIVGGVTIIGLALLHFLSMISISEDNAPKETAQKGSFLEEFKNSLRVTLFDKTFRRIIVVFVLYYVANAATYSFGAFQRNTLGFSMTFIAVLSFAYSFVRVIFSVPFGKYADRNSWEKMMRICCVICAVGFIINGFSTPETGKITYTVYYIIYAVSMAGLNNAIFNLTFDYVSEQDRSVAVGWKSAIGGVSGFLASCLASVFIEKVESSGNSLFGLTVYPQQVLSFFSGIVLITLAVYLYTTVRKLKKTI